MTRLHRLLRPRSIAVLGGGWAGNVVAQCRKMGFEGAVWPVHPERAEIGGFACYPTLSALPSAPDAVFLGVNRHASIPLVQELSTMGAGGVVAFASGWAEAGAADLQGDLVRAAGEMPLLGPNCYGVINYLDGALLWPDEHGGKRVERGVAIVSQSSNIAINLTMQARGLPVAYVACLGNAAQTGLAELSGALLDDPRVTALGLYVEGIADAPAFAALAQAARAAGKGIVALKSGRSAAAQAAAASHTAALAGGGAASAAFLAQAGVAQVRDLATLVETLKILHVHGPGLGRRICSLSCSGGEAGLVADLAADLALEMPAPEPGPAARLANVLGPLVTIANPLDYHTFIWGDGPRTTEVFTTMLSGYDAGVFVIDPPRADRCDPASFEPALAAIEAAQAATGKPAFAVSSLPENFDERRAEAMIARGVVPLLGLETALAAIRAAQTPPAIAPWSPMQAAPPRACRLVPEGRAKARLARAGIAVPKGRQADRLSALSCEGLRPPLALKGLGFAHKSEAGAVRLGLQTLEGQTEIPAATGYLVEEMVQGVRAEMLLGLRRDPVYGATLTLGMGGTAAEVWADTVTLVLPVSAAQIESALRQLRCWPLLQGWRGAAVADTQALTAAAMALQALLVASPDIEEIEINPIMLRERGAIAADAVIWEADE
jgi:acyl-CoA synthetase (NDP forming)